MTFLCLKDWLNRGKVVKPKYRLRKVSKKKAGAVRLYSVKAAAYKREYPICEICEQARSQDIHHTAGRGPNLLVESTWLALCRPCHNHIHAHPSWAREHGFLK